ncbi:MAG: hypothetical protein HW414_1090 [Dehalococcoidia bacterium]|nr:hypothetical protein [Dehalococcoidia bacterium]
MSKASPEMPDLVKALLQPESYPHRPERVEMVQTQMSFLFLTGKYVYKVKKPVNLGYLDYTTLEKRRHFCLQEVALNRRLSPDVYLGVVNVVRGESGFHVEGEGEVVEYAVKMLQLPGERMMDGLLLRGAVSLEMVSRLAEKVARFHQQAESGPRISAFGGLDIITQNNAENFEQTRPYIGRSISQEMFLRLRSWTERFIREKSSLFDRRVQEGRIRDCHGDLHSAHVCFTDGIVIYDCIEFNDRFRYGDVASEIAFLAMDMDHKGQPGLGKHWVESYTECSRDSGLPEIIDFYKCYRAHVRGKVESFKLDDSHMSQKEKDASLALSRRYFELAWHYAGLGPVLIIMTPGGGLLRCGAQGAGRGAAEGAPFRAVRRGHLFDRFLGADLWGAVPGGGEGAG